jgi:hypothetical protein
LHVFNSAGAYKNYFPALQINNRSTQLNSPLQFASGALGQIHKPFKIISRSLFVSILSGAADAVVPSPVIASPVIWYFYSAPVAAQPEQINMHVRTHAQSIYNGGLFLGRRRLSKSNQLNKHSVSEQKVACHAAASRRWYSFLLGSRSSIINSVRHSLTEVHVFINNWWECLFAVHHLRRMKFQLHSYRDCSNYLIGC